MRDLLSPGRIRRRGFTLIEVLVAAGVFVLLVLLVAQIVQAGNLIISGSRKHLSADAQAREVFSRFALDLNKMPLRPDLDVVLSSSNNALYFLSEAPGSSASASANDRNTLSLVGYRVNPSAELERLGKGLAWSNAPFLTFSTNAPSTNSVAVTASTLEGTWGSAIGSPPAYGDGADPDYSILADGVFRIFYFFQKTDGTYSLSLGNNALEGKFHEAAAIVLTLAILDGDSRKLVGDVSKLASALPNPTAADLSGGVLPAQLWKEAANDVPQFAAAAGIPESVASRVRIYQRSFHLRSQ